ncbi:MAG TPA: formate dehydrogenase subunit alpha [Polyangiaceae bacterium]
MSERDAPAGHRDASPGEPRELSVVINGVARRVAKPSTILVALNDANVHVPQLCHDPRLEPAGVCRLCLVEVRGSGHPVAACTTLLADGMVIETHTPALEHARRTLLELQARSHPPPEPGSSDNAFLREVRAYGLEHALAGHVDLERVDESNPYIRIDMSRCIDCRRCERICRQLQGQNTWQVWDRGLDTRLVPDSGTSLLESSCVSCGACVDACPSGALSDKLSHERGGATSFTRTTCPYCGVGCEMNVGTREGRLVEVRPALDAPVNKGHLCVKGRYAFGFVSAPDRVTSPLIRGSSGFQRVSWDEALGYVADRLSRIVERHGPDAVGVLGSARGTNEENYLAQKFARVALGTHNVDCCARVCHAPSAAGLGAMLGTGAATSSFDDIEHAKTLLVVGANATENHPIVGARLRRAARAGARLIVLDPRATELALSSDVHLALRPGTNVPVLNAMAWIILHENLTDEAFVARRVDEMAEFRAFIEPWTPERAAALSGVDAELIRSAARLYASNKPALCFHGLGLTEHVQGTHGVMCLVNLALLTGNVGKRGTGVNPLRGQNNVQGAAHMGCEPDRLTGLVPIETARARFEAVWQAPLPRLPGLNLMQMLDAALDQRLKALYAIGYDVLLTNPNTSRTLRALSSLELCIVQDLFMNETARQVATVFLPAACSFEKEGTFMNAERRVQRVRAALAPPGEARPDWQILCQLATKMGKSKGFSFGSAGEIWEEIRKVWPAGAGITYERLERGGLQWPCPTVEHPGTEVLHQAEFAGGLRAALRRVDFRPTDEKCSGEYPFLLTTGRKLYQFNAGTMTARTPNLTFRPADLLDVSPADAVEHGLSQAERVAVVSRHGRVVVRVNIDPALRPGQLFATFHTADVFLNRLTSGEHDGITHTPEYKVTAVRIERLVPD